LGKAARLTLTSRANRAACILHLPKAGQQPGTERLHSAILFAKAKLDAEPVALQYKVQVVGGWESEKC
jgi:hypothetical protein